MTIKLNWQGVLFCMAVATAWEIVARLHLVSPRIFPPLTLVLSQFCELTASGSLPRTLAETLYRMIAGLLAASALMIPLGIWTGRSRTVWTIISPTIESLRSLPPSLIILPTMLLMGIGDSMKIFTIFFASSFPILLNTMDGVRAIPTRFLDTARTLRASRTSMLLEVIIPATTPGLFSGVKTALPIAFIVAILSEMIGGTDGIGYFLMKSQRSFDIPQMYAATLATALTGAGLAFILNRIESACLVWYANWKQFSNQH